RLGLLVGVVDGEPEHRVGGRGLVLVLRVPPELEGPERRGDLALEDHRPCADRHELAVDPFLRDLDATVSERTAALRNGLELVAGVLADEAHGAPCRWGGERPLPRRPLPADPKRFRSGVRASAPAR